MSAVAPNFITYNRRKPEQSLLYRTVQTYWPLFLREQERAGKVIPHFIKDEFDDFLKCGLPEHGFVRLSAYYKKRARKCGFKYPRIGSITFIQRFGSALNLNIHFHTLIADGVFYEENDTFKFYRLPQPTPDELYEIVLRIQKKVTNLIQKQYSDDQAEFYDENTLAELAASSIVHKAQYGDRKGNGLKRYGVRSIEIDPEKGDPFSVNIEGFSLNARVCVSGKDRKKLEKLIRLENCMKAEPPSCKSGSHLIA